MSQGTVPIVLNSFSAAQDIIKDGINGFLVPDEQVGCQRLLQLIHDSKQLADMSIQAVEYTKKYSIENIISQWISLLNS